MFRPSTGILAKTVSAMASLFSGVDSFMFVCIVQKTEGK